MINKTLFQALKAFAGAEPEIANEDVPCVLTDVYPDFAFGAPAYTELQARSTSGGEQYRVNCPYCKDRRKRLYLSHMWNSEFVQGNTRYHCSDKLVRCFNEECLTNPDNHRDFKTKMEKVIAEIANGKEVVVAETSQQSNSLANQVRYPALSMSVTDPRIPPHVLQYIAARGWTTEQLEQWQVTVLPNYQQFTKPLLCLPVFQDGQYWFWQGRLVPTDGTEHGPVEVDPGTMKEFPKYYIPFGAKKSWALYNIDVAQYCPTMFLTEGITHVWALGKPGVCQFGKVLSQAQLQILRTRCQGKHLIIVVDMDDPEAKFKAIETMDKLLATRAFASVKMFFPPQGQDVADMRRNFNTEEELCSYMIAQAVSSSQARNSIIHGGFLTGPF